MYKIFDKGAFNALNWREKRSGTSSFKSARVPASYRIEQVREWCLENKVSAPSKIKGDWTLTRGIQNHDASAIFEKMRQEKDSNLRKHDPAAWDIDTSKKKSEAF